MDGVARWVGAVSPPLRDYRLMRVAAVTGDPHLTERLALSLSRGRASLDRIRTAVRTLAHTPHDPSARQVLAPLRRHHLESLGWLLFNQASAAEDRTDALHLFEWCRRRWGGAALSRTGRATWIEALIGLGQHERARRALVEPITTDRRLRIDAVNPYVDRALERVSPEAERRWLAEFNRYYVPAGLSPVRLESGVADPYDRLVADTPTRREVAGPLVSVVMSAYRPDHRLLTAVRSVLASTWTNLEVLVFDDASGPQYDQVLAAAAALDPRVVVDRMASNGGTYAIRNAALDRARGDFVTFHDSDDWMHPDRLALQAQHLLSHPLAPANLTMSLRTTTRLELVNARSLGLKICEPSLMMRRSVVTERIGVFDRVRKAGDAEFRQRIEAGFATKVEALAPTVPLTLQLVSPDSLSGGDIRRYRVSLDRRLHRACYEAWHLDQRARGLVPRIEADVDGGVRPYYAPPTISGISPAEPPQVCVDCDWFAAPAREQRRQVARAEALARSGLRVALRQRRDPHADGDPLLTPHPTVIRALNRGRLGFIHGDD